MLTLVSGKKLQLGALGVFACMSVAKAESGIDHNDILSCYASVFVQCPVGDQACLDFGYNDCDGSYNNTILDINALGVVTKRGTFRPEGALKAKANRIRQSIRMRRSTRER